MYIYMYVCICAKFVYICANSSTFFKIKIIVRAAPLLDMRLVQQMREGFTQSPR